MCYAFRDINPVADTHVLIIPKRRDGLSGLGAATLARTLPNPNPNPSPNERPRCRDRNPNPNPNR